MLSALARRTHLHAGSDRLWLGLALILFGLLMLLINPLREFGFNDDWAYGLVVRDLVRTGVYQTNEWLPSWIPAHTYWGALFVSLFGYSFSSLHVSTIVLAAAGLAGFYFLAREYGIAAADAFVLTLVLMISPLVLQYSVTFMSDVPYLTYLILSQLFYTRGLRKKSTGWVVLGGLSAACAIGTRLFGAAVIPGLALVWLLGKDRRQTLPLIGLGALIPAAMLLWVIAQSFVMSAGNAGSARDVQTVYFAFPALVAGQAVWRVMVSLQYMAFFCGPILIPALVEYRQRLVELRRASMSSPGGRFELMVLLGLVAFILGTSLLGSFALNQPGVMPIIKWNFFGMSSLPAAVTGLITLATIIGAFLIGRLFVLRYLKSPGWRDLPSHERVLDLTTACILAVHLILFEIGDRYLLHLLPLTLIVVGRGVPGQLARWRTVTLAACLVCALAGVLWVRQTVSRAEVEWGAADALVAQGIAPEKISGSFEWVSYHGEFSRYLADAKQKNARVLSLTYMTDWLPVVREKAEYLVIASAAPPDDPAFDIVRALPYRDMLLQEQYVYVIHRRAAP